MNQSSNRFLFLNIGAAFIGLCMAVVAQALLRLINLVTNAAFFARFSSEAALPALNHLGWWVMVVPVAGAVLVGLMARYGSEAIRGHGIPEAMEQVLLNRSRIPPRVFLLKPLSAALSIGTGGPFGAEGPIIATGGSFGSLIGQLGETTSLERKILLAAGAAAGMSATFGCPISAVILAVELLLFEFHPRSVIPVSLASVCAAGLRQGLVGAGAMFPMPDLAAPAGAAFISYMVLGAAIGCCSVLATKAVYAAEDAFDHLPMHWMWWPALGAIAVGWMGLLEPRTLGVGYENISDLISGKLVTGGPARLGLLKFTSWVVSLASGTSGGTLAPLLTVGAAAGTVFAKLAALFVPSCGLDVRMSAVVGMAAMFAGASGALLASVVFAIETTLQPNAVVPLLSGCATAYWVSRMLMKNTIMTEKIARRGVRVPAGYTADLLDRVRVVDEATVEVICLRSDDELAKVRREIEATPTKAAYHGFPVVDSRGRLEGVVTRKELFKAGADPAGVVGLLIKRKAVVIDDQASLREAARLMLQEGVGRLCVVSRDAPGKVTGILTRRDILGAYRHDEETSVPEARLRMRG